LEKLSAFSYRLSVKTGRLLGFLRTGNWEFDKEAKKKSKEK
jgi:hypothetical protein